MARPRGVPTYRLHKQSGQAVVTLADPLGNRRDVLLGKHGTAESRHEYARVIAEWEAAGRNLPQSMTATDITIAELVLRFWPWVESHYRDPDGTPTSEVENFRLSLRPLKRLYGHTPARDFGPLALKSVRQAMMEGSWLTAEEKAERERKGRPLGLARGLINQRIGRVKRLFKWAAENELVPPAVYHGLLAVPGLQRGRSMARETEPIKPVHPTWVQATLPHLRGQVAAMAELQLRTGMRPGEVCRIRGIDLDTSGRTWLYRPGSDDGPTGRHKTSWRGHQRVIAIGPKAQAILKPSLRPNLTEFLFQPAEAMAELRKAQRASRKTKVQPSQQYRKKTKPRKQPGSRYNARSYVHAVKQAIAKANRLRREKNEPEIPAWHPNQLRHSFATLVRKEYGLEAAQVLLGHQRADVAQVYAERNLALAEKVAAEVG